MKFRALLAIWLLVSCMGALADWEDQGSVNTPHGDIHYYTAGEGEPLLLLHGFFGHGAQWDTYLPAFKDKYLVIAPDMLGHGRSTITIKDFKVTSSAEAIWAVMDHLEIKSPVRGIGYSMGGMTLLEMGVQQPDRFNAMIITAAAHEITHDSPPVEWGELPPPFQQDMLRNHHGDMDKIQRLLKMSRVPEMQSASLKKLEFPVLLFAGDRDENFPLATIMQTYQALPNGQLWIVPDTGHALFWPWGNPDLVPAFLDKANQFFAE